MAEKTFNQEFQGYWLESEIKNFSTKSGVYGVYRCNYNNEKNTVSLKQLIYIGKADDLNDRINNHNKRKNWRSYLKTEESLCFSYTFVDKNYNERVEAALINSNQPPENIEYKGAFPFDKTTVNCSGEYKFIKEKNIVNRH
jgi:excinuclease UvrABC nuclease subunit